MPVPRRDLELTRDQLIRWLPTRLPEAANLRVSPLSGPGTTGFSNDTLMFDLEWDQAGQPCREELVLRIQPTGFQVFPDYDLGLQFRVMQRLAETNVPVPRVFWYEQDGALLGAPFYVMERVSGRIPSDSPPYHAEGWMTEIAPEERSAIWWSGLESLARIHRLDWRSVDVLPEPDPGSTALGRQLDYYESYLAWAAQGGRYPISEAGLAWLKRNQPAPPEPDALCWGDSRLGNMIFREGRCVAVLDWEMLTLGNPAQDVAWWLFFDEHHSEGCGVARLPGIPKPDETIDRYEEWSGTKLRHLDYYDVFAAFRFSVIMIRVGQSLKQYGLIPNESDFDSNNICTTLLAQRLERV